MMETKGKKALSLCILRVLEQHADKAQPLSTRCIIEYLKEDDANAENVQRIENYLAINGAK